MGRAGTPEIAAALGVGQAHARRLLTAALDSGQLVQRIDLTRRKPLFPYALALWLVVPADKQEDFAARAGHLSHVRLCASLAGGPSNMYVVVWLRSLSEAAVREAELVQFHNARVVDRAMILHYHKYLGQVFDDDDHRVGFVSSAHLDPVAAPS